jgi:MYXO-CTERM domain-containing protein
MRVACAAVLLGVLGWGAGCDRPVSDGGPLPAPQIARIERAAAPMPLIGPLPECSVDADCDDGKSCTRDACKSSTCVHIVECPGADQCRNPGTCGPDGSCTKPIPKSDGTPCDDGTLCTTGDACKAGLCVSSGAVVCPSSPCQDPGACDPATGQCGIGAVRPDGTSCPAGPDRCLRRWACQSGSCTGSDPIACTAGPCRDVGSCDPATGVCSSPIKRGGPCDDSDPCTYGDACAADGSCGGTRVSCVSDETAVRSCNGTSTCTVMPRPGAACDDRDPCTKGDVLRSDGTCAGMRYGCPVGACLVSSACDGNGGCKSVARPDGTSCNADDDACTPRDTCRGGTCVADPRPVTCVARDCNKASCNPATGNCQYTPTSGDRCGLTGCYSQGTCTDGVCSGVPKDCSGLSGPCGDGVCDAQSGQCVTAPRPNGTSCSAGGKCAAAAVCAFGVCELAPMTCPRPTGPCKVPSCVPETGLCTETNMPEGASCDPGTGCMTAGACDAQGRCIGAPAPNGDPCTTTEGHIGRCGAGTCLALQDPPPPPDASPDAPPPLLTDDGGTRPQGGAGKGGCGCAVPGAPPGNVALLCLVAVLALRRRRSR